MEGGETLGINCNGEEDQIKISLTLATSFCQQDIATQVPQGTTRFVAITTIDIGMAWSHNIATFGATI